jgi:osmotically inducible lipoprotein OsmB
MRKVKTIIGIGLLAMSLAGCGRDMGGRALSGGAIGAAAGALLGAAVGGNPAVGALAGAAGGAAIGAATTPGR